MPSSVPGYCFGSVVFISVHPERGGVSGARWELSLCVCALRLMGTATHSSLLAQPEPLREQAPAGGGWRGLCCDHNRGCGRWQSVL